MNPSTPARTHARTHTRTHAHTHTLGHIPHPMQRSSEMLAVLSAGVTSMHNLPAGEGGERGGEGKWERGRYTKGERAKGERGLSTSYHHIPAAKQATSYQQRARRRSNASSMYSDTLALHKCVSGRLDRPSRLPCSRHGTRRHPPATGGGCFAHPFYSRGTIFCIPVDIFLACTDRS